jgi:hypothetical protein
MQIKLRRRGLARLGGALGQTLARASGRGAPDVADATRPSAPAAISPNPQDAYPPAQVARLVEQVGVRKASLPVRATVMLGMLAGAFIAFGAMYYTLVMTGSPLGFGSARLLGGIAFSLGPVLVIVGGAELYTTT